MQDECCETHSVGSCLAGATHAHILRYGNDSQEIEPLNDDAQMLSPAYGRERHASDERADDRTGGFCIAERCTSADVAHSPMNRCRTSVSDKSLKIGQKVRRKSW